jgi:hypothetical protein
VAQALLLAQRIRDSIVSDGAVCSIRWSLGLARAHRPFVSCESQLTHRKLSPLKISNRKYFAIFYPILSACSPLACTEEAHRPRRIPAFLIATFINSEIESSHWKQSTKQNSNSYKTEFSANCPPELAELEAAFFAGFLTACLVTLIAPLSVLLVRRVEETT